MCVRVLLCFFFQNQHLICNIAYYLWSSIFFSSWHSLLIMNLCKEVKLNSLLVLLKFLFFNLDLCRVQRPMALTRSTLTILTCWFLSLNLARMKWCALRKMSLRRRSRAKSALTRPSAECPPRRLSWRSAMSTVVLTMSWSW